MRVMKTILIMLDIKVRKYLWDGLILCCYGPFKVLEHALHFSFFFPSNPIGNTSASLKAFAFKQQCFRTL